MAVRVIALVAALGYFVAAAATCPTAQAERHRGGVTAAAHVAHAANAAHDCHGKDADAIRLLPRCPCGCGDGVAPGAGPIRLSVAPPPGAPELPAVHAAAQALPEVGALPRSPAFAIDHVPLAA